MPSPSSFIAVALLGGAAVSAFTPLQPGSRLARSRRVQLSNELSSEEIEEMEVRAEAAEMVKKVKSNMYNEKGVAYAPWMVNQVDEEAYEAAKYMRKQRKMKEAKERQALNEGVDLAGRGNTLVGDEMSGQGLKYKMVGEEVELSWYTDDEADNLGFKIQKRAARTEDWITVASYQDWGPLASKGPKGGEYTFLDPTSEQGDWIYRVVDEDTSGKSSILCQALIEVQGKGEAMVQTVLLGGFGLFFVSLIAAGVFLDPVQ